MIGPAMLLALVQTTAPAATESRPQDAPPTNVLLIVTDDQGYADLGCYGATDFETPRLDALASEGLRGTSFYVSQATCTSSRASFQTGCYANRIGLQGALMPWDRVGLDAAETTLGELFSSRGYATFFVGKWHLGHEPQHLPHRHGFDHWFGLPYSNDMWPFDQLGQPVGEDHYKRKYPPLPLMLDDEQLDRIESLEEQGQLTARYTDVALAFIEEQAPRGPFFLQLMHSMPHVPISTTEAFAGSAATPYGDVIEELDASTGRILDALDRAGVAERTLVIFSSDNGPWLNYGDHAGSALPLREGKGSMWEGGCRVPFLARLPGVIPAGTVDERLMASVDLLPTFAELIGADLPPLPIDGASLLSAWRDPGAPAAREEFIYFYNGALHAVREGRFKLHVPHSYRSYERMTPGTGGRGGPTATGRTSYELYDLVADPGERRNVADLHPEIVERLRARAERAREELGDGERRGSGQRAPATPDDREQP